jgi:hypothetical protein
MALLLQCELEMVQFLDKLLVAAFGRRIHSVVAIDVYFFLKRLVDVGWRVIFPVCHMRCPRLSGKGWFGTYYCGRLLRELFKVSTGK